MEKEQKQIFKVSLSVTIKTYRCTLKSSFINSILKTFINKLKNECVLKVSYQLLLVIYNLGNRHTIPPHCIKTSNPKLTFFLPLSVEMVCPQNLYPQHAPTPNTPSLLQKKSTVVFCITGATSYLFLYLKHWSYLFSCLSEGSRYY